MQQVSMRTLVLMVLLLVSVTAHCYVDLTPTASAEAAWLVDGDPGGTDDPPPEIAWLTTDDPKGTDDPPPENIRLTSDDPNGTDDPPPETL